MGRKNTAGKISRACTFGAKLQKYYDFFKFYFWIALNGYLDKFLTWISLNLPKEALNALRIIQFIIGTNFWNTLYTAFLLYFKTSKKYLEMSQIYLTFMGLNNSHFTSATRNVFFLTENFLTEKKKKKKHASRHAFKWRQCYKRELSL